MTRNAITPIFIYLLSNFIFVEILSSKFDGLGALAAEFFSPLIAIAALYYLLKASKAEWFWCGFFIGALWMHWISFSLIYFDLAFLIPIEILGICLVYAFIFRIFAIFDAPVLRAACFLILKFIHPFGFDWLNFEQVLGYSKLESSRDAEKEYAMGDVEKHVLDDFIDNLDHEIDFEN